MAHYEATVPSVRSHQATFDYLSRFSNTADWDPGAKRGRDLQDGARVDVGSRFSLDFAIGPQTQELVYEVTELDRPDRIRLVADGGWFTSDDVIEVSGTDESASVTYAADVRLKGPLALFDPLMRIGFKRVGDKAAAGLRQTLARSS